MKKLIICVGLNPAYKIYIPYYIIFLYHTNSDCDLLLITDDTFVENYDEALEYATNLYGKDKIRILINPEYLTKLPKHEKLKTHLVARSTIPASYYENYDYVYCGDIDILITDKNIFKSHINNYIDKYNSTLSNVVRYGKNREILHRVTGLQMIDVKKYLKKYKEKIDNFDWDIFLSWIEEIDSKYIFDEHIWFYILDDDDIKILSINRYRPFHGPHLGILRGGICKLIDKKTKKIEFPLDNIHKGILKERFYNIKSKESTRYTWYDSKRIIESKEFEIVHNLLNDLKVKLLNEVAYFDEDNN
jgi:hypothetical protein